MRYSYPNVVVFETLLNLISVIWVILYFHLGSVIVAYTAFLSKLLNYQPLTSRWFLINEISARRRHGLWLFSGVVSWHSAENALLMVMGS
jgi:hypothetical protein